jgi:hypothetical protein
LPITLRFRDVPPAIQRRLREALEDVLDGDWSVTLSQSHLDGQWHLQLDGRGERYRLVLPALQDVRVTTLRHVLRRLLESGAGSHPASMPSTVPVDEVKAP